MSPQQGSRPNFGANSWLVEEMYEKYIADPASVGESWQEFFEDYRSIMAPAYPESPSPTAGAPTTTPSLTSPKPAPAEPDAEERGEPIRGVGAAIAKNMKASLEVPTATSFRDIPARLLEVNRRIINGYRSRRGLGKVSFTHLIGYAIIRAINEAAPNMRNSFAEGADGKPRIVRSEQLNLGLAVDVDKGDGTRTLVVPVVKGAERLDFSGFLAAYEEIIRKVRNNKLTLDDYQGANVTLTNPGTIGTIQSVPRLMPGQGVIVGVGAIGYPAEFEGADTRNLSRLGVSKIVTVTSTYDHRIIQGAESGLFLKHVHELLLGGHDFYSGIFAELDMPYEAVKWRPDINAADPEDAMLEKQNAVAKITRVYRVRGHLMADLDPLRWKKPITPIELDPATYNLTIWDLDREFLTDGVGGQRKMTLGDILGVLRDAYCRTVGVEYMHIQSTEEQRWIQAEIEGVNPVTTTEEQTRILERLNAAEAFERFLATKYVGTKRFGIEGAESAIPLLDAILSGAADEGIDSVVMGMAHRGRLNVLSNILGKSYEAIFSEFEGYVDPGTVQGTGDVKYHLGAQGLYRSAAGNTVPVELAANPSHLETVDPIVMGMVRAQQDQIEPAGAYSVLPLLVHGDAAFAGQGVVAECLAMSDLMGYRIGGTIHVIINNQIGFTTSPDHSRSSQYPSDVAKMIQAPIFHVNGDDPEACVRVARLAWKYRQKFNRDVVIDMVSYRRHGHNEGDDPSYTQPLMYRAIKERRSVRKGYVETLVTRGDITLEEAEQALTDFQAKLQVALDETRAADQGAVDIPPPAPPIGVLPAIETGADRKVLDKVFGQLTNYPDGFTPHPKLARQFDTRHALYYDEGVLDWATAEALAFGSLLLEGHSVRLAGEDSRRGTFSQRHAALIDNVTGEPWLPLTALDGKGGGFWVYDSLLSEYAALGYEYGYAHENPNALVLWEAQFGDFVNGAQIVIDQYIVAAEDKWKQNNGLVMLLPHGYEGQGPEHSSARIERFLTAAAEDNIQVCNATTAAQYFHLLRRQVHQARRTPLIVFTPKQGLRMAETRSTVDELTAGSFAEVLDDPGQIDRDAVKRVMLCSGKVAWDLINERDRRGETVAVVRVEQLYPLPLDQIVDVLTTGYPNADELMWVQEEPENMGPWKYMEHHIWRLRDRGFDLMHAARVASGSPAAGSRTVHDREHVDLMDAAFGRGLQPRS